MLRTSTFAVAALAIGAMTLFTGCKSSYSTCSNGSCGGATLTKADIIAAQKEWGAGIVAISKVHKDGGDYKARATEHIKTLYAYGETPVMFKPTLAADDQFRETFTEALNYFIGKAGTEDGGFAISGWCLRRPWRPSPARSKEQPYFTGSTTVSAEPTS